MGDAAEALARLAVPIAVVAILLFLALRRPLAAAVQVEDGPEDELYRVYTREFDLAIPAGQALDQLDTASPDAAKGWLKGSQIGGQALQVELLLAGQRKALAPDRDGLIAALRAALSAVDPAEIVVAMLVDQSGSMKDRRIASVAVTTSLIAELVDDLGARSEVLGFSSAGWKGGHARLKWLKEGKPKRPGRLAALMHVVYKSAAEPALGEQERGVMVHPDLLRENIDGEAILWAWDRLAARPEPRKVLIVISDGAPVDDSTLMENGPSYLYRHLKTVLRRMKEEPNLTLGGLGIEHRVASLYPLSEEVTKLDDMPRDGIRLLERLLAASSRVANRV